MRSRIAFAALAAAAPTLAQTNTAYPTISLFVPLGAQGPLAASVITAAPSATVLAIGCMEDPAIVCATGCDLDNSITMTCGESTLAYTWTGNDAQFNTNVSSLVRGVTTVSCALYGGTSATSADCTGVSALPSDNFSANSTTTTILNASQISYMPITITAGAASAKSGLVLASSSSSNHAAANSASSSGGASAPIATSAMKYAIGGAVAGWGAVAML